MKSLSTLTIILIAIALIATVAAAGLFLFMQSQPLVPAGVITGICQTTSSVLQTVTPGQTGADLYVCGTSPNVQPVLDTSSTGGTATPTFTLPAPFSKLVLVSSSSGTQCPNNAANITLTSGSPVTFTANQGYDYCASYGPAPATGLPAWSVSWSQ